MPGLVPLAPPQPRTMSVVARIFLVVTILLAIALAVLRSIGDTTDPAMMVGEQFGALLVLVAVPLLVAWLSAGRKKVRHPNRFALIFCLISGFFSLVNIPSIINSEEPTARFARLMREAAGIQPVSHRNFGRERRFDDEIRDRYRKLLQQNRDYEESVKTMDNSHVKELNSAASFASPDSGREALAQLHALYDVDAAEEGKVRAIMVDMREVFEKYASSPKERDALLKGFDSSSAAQFAKRQQALDAEKAWVDAEDDVYAYAGAHSNVFRLVNGHLIAADEAVRSEFNDRLEAEKAKRKAFLQLQEQFRQSQSDTLKKMGLNNGDLGK